MAGGVGGQSAGGSAGGTGGVDGTTLATNSNGGAGATNNTSGGGGGGGGAGVYRSEQGGNGGAGSGGAGGSGATIGGGLIGFGRDNTITNTAGGPGRSGNSASNTGSGGGGGSGGGNVFTSALVSNSGPDTLTGANTGGDGGTGGDGNGAGGGGGGGAGGYALINDTNTSSFTNSAGSTLTAGNGGNGGNSTLGGGGFGGSGGVAFYSETATTLVNAGQIQGGTGGSGGSGGTVGTAGAGGRGIVGANLTITNSGTIAGGLSGDGVTQADAIAFMGGTNSLTLNTTATNGGLTGGLGLGGTVTIAPATGGTTLSSVLHDYSGTVSGSLVESGAGTLTLTGANTYTGGTTLNAGTLDLNAATTLNQGVITSGAAGMGGIAFGAMGPATLRVEAAAFNTNGTTSNLAYGLSSFAVGDVIDLANLTSADASASYTGTTLTVHNGAGQTDTLAINAAPSGYQYSIQSDGSTGTDVVLTAVVLPTITGTHSTADTAEATVTPFTGVTIADRNASPMDSLAITLMGGGGTLTGQNGDLVQTGANTYELAVTTPANLSAELDALTFTPTNGTPGATATTTFQLVDTSNAGTMATDGRTVITDTAAPAPVSAGGGDTSSAPAPLPAPTPTPSPMPVMTSPAPSPSSIPVAPGSGGAVGVTPADSVSISPSVTYADGVFTLTGTASSASGVSSVEISAVLNDGTRQDLGAATLNGDGAFVYSDIIGANQQSFIQATLTDGAGVQTVSADPSFSLTGGIDQVRYEARQTIYTSDGSSIVTTSLFKADGSRQVDAAAGGQTLNSDFFVTYNNAGAPDNLFSFDTGYGLNVFNGLRVNGPDHDVLTFIGSDFNNSFSSLLNNTKNTKAGAVIMDPTSGDSVRLAGINKSQIVHNPGDFTFHL